MGAVAPTVRRAIRCEKVLESKPLNDETIEEASSLVLDDAAPIGDIRGSANYRKAAIVSVVFQALHQAALEKSGHNE
jgi:CO/xanthine dehydrogenase FAD-binding subunit